MVDPKTPDIWTLLFDQTPVIIRAVLGLLTLGIFTLAGVLYRWHRDDLKEVHDRVDRLEHVMDERHQETNRLLFQIVQNTGREK
ncbi:hypothetical protein [Halomonas rhizosphaerae]|uniref:Uncharacterized protein n=1 Tax=Halomonas rhizosphaerae TaxID=3043296 RepID=A0ABT6UXC2_9GAMM|nr:hypothetical protein [Halomonas rhizosphaerae]MDI5890620.1 hypothetical protein [Halomonas rhizosphaerae]